MSAIGFPVSNPDEFKRLAKQAMQAGKGIEVPGIGSYRQWSPGTGAELWAQVNKKGEPFGLHPHFAGKARMRVKLTKRVARHRDTALDGAFYGWANPGGLSGDGDYPFAFDSPDYRSHEALTLPKIVSVQLAAFAQDLEAYPSEKEMRSSVGWMKDMAPESCIPSGTFLPSGGIIDPPKSEIIFCGTVQETSTLTNSFSGQQFAWARVHTLGGELDVVADPATVKGTITKNGIVGSMCWLSGRMTQEEA